MKEILLRGNKVSKSFPRGREDTPVLRGIDVEIYDGDFTVIMGPSGAGKSTLLYALSGMEKITDGQVFYKNEEISRYSEKQMADLRSSQFGFVFQQTHLVSNLTLFENVAVAGYLDAARSQREVDGKARRLLENMGVGNAADRLPYQTSGGESQRAAIARAMINEPGLLFADEPTGALNRKSTDHVFDLLTGLNQASQSILMVTHDLRAAIRGNRILYLEDGAILDEFSLSGFTPEQERERELAVGQWLSGLSW